MLKTLHSSITMIFEEHERNLLIAFCPKGTPLPGKSPINSEE